MFVMRYFLLFSLLLVPLLFKGQEKNIADTAKNIKIESDVKQKTEFPLIDMDIITGKKPLKLSPSPGLYLEGLDKYLPEKKFNPQKLELNLNLTPPKRLKDVVKEDPLKAIILGGAIFLGMMNHTIYGEDKMLKIRIEQGVQSRSNIPETAKSAHGAITVNNE